MRGQLLQPEYVSKHEFAEFKGDMRNFRLEFNDFKEEMYLFKDEMYLFKSEMYSFREETNRRFDRIDKRLDIQSKQIAELKEDIPRYMAMLREGFREDLRVVTDQFMALSQKLDKHL